MILFPSGVDKIAPVLVKALGALREPPRTGKANVPNRRDYYYMTLPDLLTAVRTVFAEHELAILQSHDYDDGHVVVTTMVLHESGQMVVTEPLHIRCAPDAQSIGSAGTYAKRYQLAALVGLAGGDDDDGRTATTTKPPDPPPSSDPVVPPPGFQHGSHKPGTASDASIGNLWGHLRRAGMDEAGARKWVAHRLSIPETWSSKELSQAQVSALITRLGTPDE